MYSDEEILKICAPFTMTTILRQKQTLESVQYIIENTIEGDLIELGVWKGGSIMIMIYKLLQLGITNRHIHLYDTFNGMTQPSINDVDVHGAKAIDISRYIDLDKWCLSPYDEVYNNIKSTNYPMEYIHFHIGDIMNVQINDIPKQIALLRIDNDWYELHKFELPLFEPNVTQKGIITSDDYSYWSGCKKAIDDYLINKYGTYNIIQIDDCGVYWYKK